MAAINGTQAALPSSLEYEAVVDRGTKRVTVWASASGNSRVLHGRGIIWSGTLTEALGLAGAILLAMQQGGYSELKVVK